MRNYWLRTLIIAVAVFGAAMALADGANAQRRYRRGGLTKAQVDKIIRRVETRTDSFVSSFDNALDRTRLDGTRREDNLNERAGASLQLTRHRWRIPLKRERQVLRRRQIIATESSASASS